jgi:hypothetical protein
MKDTCFVVVLLVVIPKLLFANRKSRGNNRVNMPQVLLSACMSPVCFILFYSLHFSVCFPFPYHFFHFLLFCLSSIVSLIVGGREE